LKRAIYLIIGVLILSSCGENENHITDKDFVEITRKYSPNKENLILEYHYDIGALGYSRRQIAILKESNLDKNLLEFNLPANKKYRKIKWINDNEIEAEVDIMNNHRQGRISSIEEFKVKDIRVKTKLFDIPIEGKLAIEARKLSPNEELELVAYRYLTKGNLNFIHISVIKKGEKLPKIGNYFIGNIMSDYILNANWASNNEIEIVTNSLFEEDLKYFFVKNRPQIKYSIKVDNTTYKSKYRWTNDETVKKTF
jgi:hypothetical protein